MGAHLRASLRFALRSPSTFILAGLGVLAVLAGLALSVLALRGSSASQLTLVLETGTATGVLAGIWLLAVSLEVDRHSGFTQASDQTRPGIEGRVLGRLLGAGVAALLAALPTLVLGAAIEGEGGEVMYLLFTISVQVGLALAWGSLLHALGTPPQGLLLGVVALWILGHLPWGHAGWWEGRPGRALSGLLPGAPFELARPWAPLLAVLGLTALSLSLLRPRSRSV